MVTDGRRRIGETSRSFSLFPKSRLRAALEKRLSFLSAVRPFLLLAICIVVLKPFPAAAADDMGCALGIARNDPGLHRPGLHRPGFHRVAAWERDVPSGQVRFTFVGHATFLIETPGGASAVTDYNGMRRPPYLPDAVTMNNAHSTHFSFFVEPEIPHALPGWDPGGGVALHAVTFKDMSIFNVPTNLRTRIDGGVTNGNSIFVFKSQNLCIAHLGHLHHVLTPEQHRRIRRVDVLFINVDGNTLSYRDALKVIDQISPRLVIPMHFTFAGVAQRFLDFIKDHYPVRLGASPTVTIGESTLPARTEVLFLQPQFY